MERYRESPVVLTVVLLALVISLALRVHPVPETPAVELSAVPVTQQSGGAKTGPGTGNETSSIPEPVDAFVVPDDPYRLDVSNWMEYFIDEEARYPSVTTEVMAKANSAFSEEFRDAGGRTHWGVHNAVCWFRIPLRSNETQPRALVASNLVDHLEFDLAPGRTTYIYYRLEYADAGIVCTPSISDEEAHRRALTRRTVYASIMLGMYLALFLYNLFLAVVTGGPAHPPYLAGLLFFGAYLVFREFDIAPFGYDIASSSFSLAGYICMLIFARAYFRVERRERALTAAHVGLVVFGLVSAWIAVYASYLGSVLKYVFSGLLVGYAVWISLSRLSGERGNEGDRFRAAVFLASWAPALIGLSLTIPSSVGLVAYRDRGVLDFVASNPGMYLQIGIQMLILAFALGYRINEEQRAARSAQSESRALARRDALRRDFVLYVSHEVRTLVMVTAGIIDGVIEGRLGSADEEATAGLRSARRRISTLEDHIGNLLLFTRIHAGGTHPRMRTRNVSRTVIQQSLSYQSLADAKRIDFTADVDESAPIYARINDHLFELALNNLLSNAFKHTQEGGAVAVGVRRDSEGTTCNVEVRNTGRRLPESGREWIFGKLNRLRTGIDGMGLGLYMVRQCAELMNGHAEANEDGKWTVFSLSLPQAATPADEGNAADGNAADSDAGDAGDAYSDAAAGEVREADGGAGMQRPSTEDAGGSGGSSVGPAPLSDGPLSPKRRPTILFVEDNEELRKLIVADLGDSFNVVESSDGVDALARLRGSGLPDLVLTDVLMPRMDGITLFREIRTNLDLDLPFVFLSAVDDDAERDALFALGAVDFIAKPVRVEVVRRKIHNLLAWHSRQLAKQRDSLKSAVLAIFDEPGTDDRQQGQCPPAAEVDSAALERLSSREREIAVLVLDGFRDKEIAARLRLATSTVSNYLQRIYRKLDVRGRTELVHVLLNGEPTKDATE